MGFEEFLPKEEENELLLEEDKEIEKISPNHVYDVITSKKPDWQSILYDLINRKKVLKRNQLFISSKGGLIGVPINKNVQAYVTNYLNNELDISKKFIFNKKKYRD